MRKLAGDIAGLFATGRVALGLVVTVFSLYLLSTSRAPAAGGSFGQAFGARALPAALGAVTCLLFYGLCRRVELSRLASLLGSAGLAFGTIVWVYARHPAPEILQAVAFTGFFTGVLAAPTVPGWRAGLLLGSTGGLMIGTRLGLAWALPGVALFVGWQLREHKRAMVLTLGTAAAVLLPMFVMLVVTGANTAVIAWSERRWVTVWGLLFAPGKSLLIYSPPLVLTVLAFFRVWRQRRALLVAMVAALAPVVLLDQALLGAEHGWGARAAVFAVPVLFLPAACLIDHVLRMHGRMRMIAVAGVTFVIALGFAVQILGNAFHWDDFARIEREARHRWLGTPRPAAQGNGNGFEELHGLAWLPPFSPLEGNFWLFRHALLTRHDWAAAEADAPWKRYTRLKLDIARSYAQVRIDWWPLDLRRRP